MIRILILGGGFGGIRCALDLDKKFKSSSGIEITLIDRNSYHLFTPAIYEVASAYGIKRDPFAIQLRKTVCLPYDDIFSGTKVDFIQAEIERIDLSNKTVKTGGGQVSDFDYLVIGLGGETADYGIPGVKEYAYQFKTLEDALMINKKLDNISEEFKQNGRTEPFSFLICGGGFTGIELAAELGCCSKVIRAKCKLRGRCATISLFEAGSKVLPTISDKERDFIKRRLTKLGVILVENSSIEEVSADFIKLKTGQKIHGDLIIWTAGIKSNRLILDVEGLELSNMGKIKVENTLKVNGVENVYALGDAVEFINPIGQKLIPAFAYVSTDQGRIVAENIYNSVGNKTLKPYKPFSNVWIIPIGGKFALAHLWGGFLIKGFWGWIVRELVDVRYLLSIFSIKEAIEVFFNEITIFTKND